MPPTYILSRPEMMPGLFNDSGPVEACQRCLVALTNLLPDEMPSSTPHKRRRLIPAEARPGPLKESKARKLLSEISHHEATLLLVITGDMMYGLVSNDGESLRRSRWWLLTRRYLDTTSEISRLVLGELRSR